jgi:hypothetical protein
VAPKSSFPFIVAGISIALVSTWSSPSPAADARRDRVVAAALKTYIHGMSSEIAQREIAAGDVPILLELLADGAFPRRDNVVAFLAYLGGDDAAQALSDFLRQPPADVEAAVEDRALLLAPHALGHMARRGSGRAAGELLAITRNGENGGVLAGAAARSSRANEMRDDLLESAVRALGHANTAAARTRLSDIATGRTVPAPRGRSLARVALDALAEAGGGDSISSNDASPNVDDATAAESLGELGSESLPEAFVEQGGVDDSALDYANHVNVTNPMTDARLDAILADASMRVGRDDFDTDVGCCVTFSRQGSQRSFGSNGDGLDVIDTSSEVSTVLSHSSARVKVVRLINYCGSAGTNIIGCGWIGGNGIALVRYGSTAGEGALWVHEYGHNVGLGHNSSDSRLIMYPYLSSNHAVTQTDCDRYHSPSSGAQADIVEVGMCTDDDLDNVHTVVDNCPSIANFSQADADLDGIGDVCEGGCGNGAIDGGEQCDGSALAGNTCQSLGFDGGGLSCRSDCTLNTSGCYACGDGVRDAGEECDGGALGGASCGDLGCASGSVSCTASCTLNYAACSNCPVCDGDGVCETDENCDGCPSDCIAANGATCGNGLCEAGNGENCVNCAADCNGSQSGKPSSRWCCGFGQPGAVGCADSRCGSAGFACTTTLSSASCCGDGSCSGIENGDNCEIDCGPPPPPPACGDGACNADENRCTCAVDCGAPGAEICNDGIDNDCDAAVDCNDSGCASSTACSCAQVGTACSSAADCCSFKCRGKICR